MPRRHLLALVILALVVATVLAVGPGYSVWRFIAYERLSVGHGRECSYTLFLGKRASWLPGSDTATEVVTAAEARRLIASGVWCHQAPSMELVVEAAGGSLATSVEPDEAFLHVGMELTAVRDVTFLGVARVTQIDGSAVRLKLIYQEATVQIGDLLITSPGDSPCSCTQQAVEGVEE